MDNKDFKVDLQLFAGDEEGKDKDNKSEEVNPIELEEALGKALESTTKAKKKEPLPPIDEEDEEDEEEEEEGLKVKAKKAKKSEAAKKSEGDDDEEPDFEELSKGLEEEVLEREEKATEEILDAVPFIKALFDTLENQMCKMVEGIVYLTDEQKKIKKELRKSSEIDVAQAKLIKSMSENMRKMGETPLPRKSVLGQNFEIIQKAGSDSEEKKFSFTKLQAIDKLTALCKADEITLEELTKAEWRIQKGVPLEGELDHINGLLSK